MQYTPVHPLGHGAVGHRLAGGYNTLEVAQALWTQVYMVLLTLHPGKNTQLTWFSTILWDGVAMPRDYVWSLDGAHGSTRRASPGSAPVQAHETLPAGRERPNQGNRPAQFPQSPRQNYESPRAKYTSS